MTYGKVIWKFPVLSPAVDAEHGNKGLITLWLPINSQVLDFQFQDDKLVAWVLCSEDRARAFVEEGMTQAFTYYVVNTGYVFDYQPTITRYMKTIQNRNIVWHFFKIIGGDTSNEQ